MKKIIAVLIMMAVLMCGCEEENQNEAEMNSPEEKGDISLEKKESNIYKTEELFIENLGDIEFKIPKVFNEDTRERGEWKYYYYEDLMLATNIENNEKITNEELVNNVDSLVDGILDGEDDGVLIQKGTTETPIGMVAKISAEKTIKSGRYICYYIIFCYESNVYNIGLLEEKESQWDYSKDFDCLIESITKKGEAGFNGDEIRDFSNDFENFKKWFGENSKEIIYSEYINEENKGTYKTSTGTVSDISNSIKWIDFIQRTEEGYFEQDTKLENVILENSTNFEDFQIGDGIKIYYYINENNEDEILAIEKTEPEFSLDEYVNYYKEQCKEYTYEDIARNPENMNGEYAKLKGKVIQVLESGNAVQIRVDITVSEYGNYSDTVFVSYYKKSETEDRILEDDIITIYGKLDGTETYNAVLGQQITLPKINAEYVEIN